jgi:hypothetical protein
MKKLTWAIAAVALGAGAAYFLDPRQGPQRRRQWQGQAADWLHGLQQRAGASTQALGENLGRLRDRLHKPAEAVVRDDGLAPLEMTPEPLEREPANHHRLLMGLAVATPVAMAVGAAALLRQRSESGEWLH